VSTFTDIIVEEHGAVALVKLNRPASLNAMGGTMLQELAAYLDSLNRGAYSTRAVVLTGEGRAFCAGGDVTRFPGANAGAQRPPWHPPQPTASPIAPAVIARPGGPAGG
jgi:enoyl-CoA hydratase/carnithine racemase